MVDYWPIVRAVRAFPPLEVSLLGLRDSPSTAEPRATPFLVAIDRAILGSVAGRAQTGTPAPWLEGSYQSRYNPKDPPCGRPQHPRPCGAAGLCCALTFKKILKYLD